MEPIAVDKATRRDRFRFLLPILLFLSSNHTNADTSGKLIQVGGNSQVRTIAEAAAMARDGDTVVIAPGEYYGDVAVWKQDRLTIRSGAGGRVKLIAAGSNADGKAIWVINGGRITVEDIDFSGARAPDHNGAGIRFEKGRLLVRRCSFMNSENGILTDDGDSVLEIENSEFGDNGNENGSAHNLYVGKIQTLKVRGSYFHHARHGDLLKSRARENLIMYNRLTDELGGQASYELEFPNGGLAYVIGNIVEQSASTDNPTIISYGTEGYPAPANELYLASNTIVDDRPDNGIVLQVKPGAQQVEAINNLVVGQRKLEGGQIRNWRERIQDLAKAAYKQDWKLLRNEDNSIKGKFTNNINADWSLFALPMRYDYRLVPGSGLDGKFVLPGEVNGISMVPSAEYAHPASTSALTARPRFPGALQSQALARRAD